MPLQDESRAFDFTGATCHLAGTFFPTSPEAKLLAAPYGLQLLNLEPGFVTFQKPFSVMTVLSCAVFLLEAGELRPVIMVFYYMVTGTTTEQQRMVLAGELRSGEHGCPPPLGRSVSRD